MMNYKLVGNNDFNNPLKTLLDNRGVDNPNYLSDFKDGFECGYEKLSNINEAVAKIKDYIWNFKGFKIGMICDSDCDGFTSAALLYNYLYKTHDIKCKCYFHTMKQHGISDEIFNEILNDKLDLLLVPDAGTNDTEQCKILSENGTAVIILDHHLKEQDNPYAVIVNNQIGDYPNKELCGVGIVYKFIQALNEDLWYDTPIEYLDLVALGNIGDCMDIRSTETRSLIELGLSNINNKFIAELFEQLLIANGHSKNIIDIQFYVVPYINALIRVGTSEEKETMFKAFTENESGRYTYNSRANGETEENVYAHAVRLCKNAKARQSKQVEKQMNNLLKNIKTNRNIIIEDVTKSITQEFTGLVAIKIAEMFKKPTLLLRENLNDKTVLSGSARNFNNSVISDLKFAVNQLDSVVSTAGHANAFGSTVIKDKITDVYDEMDSYLKKNDIALRAEQLVDFEIDWYDLDMDIFKKISDLKQYYGTGIEECFVCVKNIPVSIKDIHLKGKDQTTWSILDEDFGIEIIKFKNKPDDEILTWFGEDFTLNVIGQISFNTFGGIRTPQIRVVDYEMIYEEDDDFEW